MPACQKLLLPPIRVKTAIFPLARALSLPFAPLIRAGRFSGRRRRIPSASSVPLRSSRAKFHFICLSTCSARPSLSHSRSRLPTERPRNGVLIHRHTRSSPKLILFILGSSPLSPSLSASCFCPHFVFYFLALLIWFRIRSRNW